MYVADQNIRLKDRRISHYFEGVELKNTPHYKVGNSKSNLRTLSDQWRFVPEDEESDPALDRFGVDRARERIILKSETQWFDTLGRTNVNAFVRAEGAIKFEYPETLRAGAVNVGDDTPYTEDYGRQDLFPHSEFSIMPRMFLDVDVVGEWGGYDATYGLAADAKSFHSEANTLRRPADQIDITNYAQTVGGFTERDTKEVRLTVGSVPEGVLRYGEEGYYAAGQWVERTIKLDNMRPNVARATQVFSRGVAIRFTLWMYEMEPTVWTGERNVSALMHSLLTRVPPGERLELPFHNIGVDLKFKGQIVLS